MNCFYDEQDRRIFTPEGFTSISSKKNLIVSERKRRVKKKKERMERKKMRKRERKQKRKRDSKGVNQSFHPAQKIFLKL